MRVNTYELSLPLPFPFFHRNLTTSCQKPSRLPFRLASLIEEKEFVEGASLDRRRSSRLRWIIVEWKIRKANLKFHTLLKTHEFHISRDPSIMRSINNPPLISLIRPNLELETFHRFIKYKFFIKYIWPLLTRMEYLSKDENWMKGGEIGKISPSQNSNSSRRKLSFRISGFSRRRRDWSSWEIVSCLPCNLSVRWKRKHPMLHS